MSASIMGILNVTPDSFSDGGDYYNIDQAVLRAKKMLEQGADWLDIGGESTRPGAKVVALKEEIRRTIPIIQALKREKISAKLSIDTTKPKVMQQAIEMGVNMINDISACQHPESVRILSDNAHVQLCLMHMQGTPRTMQDDPYYQDVVKEISHFFQQRIEYLRYHGIESHRIYIDPGFGFGKTLEHNLALFHNITHFKQLATELGCAGLLVGVSRKRFIGEISKVSNAKERIIGSVIAAILAANMGTDIIRVHDVEETQQALSSYTRLHTS